MLFCARAFWENWSTGCASKITPEEFVEDLHEISLGLARKIIAEEAGAQNVIPILQNKEV